MSSHHIVRDEQEPAIIITELRANYWKAIEQLLGWSPTVIVAADLVETILLRGIKIDVVVGSALHLDAVDTLLVDQQPIYMLASDDEDKLATPIKYLLSKNYKAVNVFSEFDPQKSLDQNINSIWYDDKLRYVKSTDYRFKKWLPENTSLHIMMMNEQQEMKVEGMTKVGDHQFIATSSGMVSMVSHQEFWIGQAY